jgi:hypothetical protein
MKFFVKHPDKFRRKSEVPNCYSPKTRMAKDKCCENDLYVEIGEHLDILNQNPVVMIARIFNMLKCWMTGNSSFVELERLCTRTSSTT